jgi:hypothetical protein
MKKAIAPLIAALLIALVCSGAMADWKWKAWKGHHTKLFDAQNACTNTDSMECEPFLAAAMAVAEVFSEIAKPDEKGDLIVTFRDAVQERCSSNWATHERANSTTFGTRAPREQRQRQEHLFRQRTYARLARVVSFVEEEFFAARRFVSRARW